MLKKYKNLNEHAKCNKECNGFVCNQSIQTLYQLLETATSFFYYYLFTLLRFRLNTYKQQDFQVIVIDFRIFEVEIIN